MSETEQNYYTMTPEEFQKLPITTLEKFETELKETIEYMEYLYSILPDDTYQEAQKSAEEVLKVILKVIQDKYDTDDYQGCSCPPLE